ncbi:MAG: N-acyl-D-amino-acid deacylase family protein [Nitrospirota bacterium]
MIDILIQRGLLVDGSGSEPFEGDIGIAGERIVSVKKTVSLRRSRTGVSAKKRIDAEGLVVCPGFIDTHAHSEFTLLADPRAEGKVLQGITTEINGNCGLSAAPLLGEALERREEDLSEYDIRERWKSFPEYFSLLRKRGIAVNFLTLAGHGNLRASVVGYRDREATEKERAQMCRLLGQSLREGAIGLSSGLIYPPGVYSDREELIGLLRVMSVRKRSITGFPAQGSEEGASGIYTTHMRSEGDGLIESVRETLALGREAKIKVHISHIKTSGEKNWHKADEVIAMMEDAGKRGFRVTADRYPYVAASTDLDTVLPEWTYEGGNREELRRITDPDICSRIRREILQAHPEKRYWESIRISAVRSRKNVWMEGRSIADIADGTGTEPVDMLIRILREEKLRAGAVFFSMSEKNLNKFLSLPSVMIGTDSAARSYSGPTRRGKPHPRGFGSFPRFLGGYVRDKGMMSIQEAVHKITMLPAQTFGIRDRGVLKKGAYADIVLWHYQGIRDRATFEEPFLSPEGIHTVLVNGKLVVRDGETTPCRPGRVLEHGR